MRRQVSAFTLIELLIVVAIIAILAAIAVPNFLEAQTRAKVSRVKADMRSMATAIETYILDWNSYPPCNNFGLPGRRTTEGDIDPRDRTLERLSTPQAYLTSAFLNDPFFTNMVISASTVAGLAGAAPFAQDVNENPQYVSIFYTSWDPTGRTVVFADASGPFDDGQRPGRSWCTQSGGPDRTRIAIGGILDNSPAVEIVDILYDATNGTVSFGDIFRVGGQFGGDGGSSGAYGGGFSAGVARFQN